MNHSMHSNIPMEMAGRDHHFMMITDFKKGFMLYWFSPFQLCFWHFTKMVEKSRSKTQWRDHRRWFIKMESNDYEIGWYKYRSLTI